MEQKPVWKQNQSLFISKNEALGKVYFNDIGFAERTVETIEHSSEEENSYEVVRGEKYYEFVPSLDGGIHLLKDYI